jgi:Cof subfamily protein (haloacid dehalogenase superfamily)
MEDNQVKMYKLIAIDLDGTLLNSKKRISETNIKYIKEVIEKEVKVVVCSGRIYAGAKIFARQISVNDTLIACNGAIIKDIGTDEVLYYNSMNIPDCIRVIDICHELDIYFHVYIGDTMYTERLEFSSLFYWKRNQELPQDEQVDIRLVQNMYEVIEKNAGKVLKIVVISNDPNILADARKKVCCIDSVEVMSSDSNNFEVMNQGVNKGNALKFIAGKLGIKREEIIAIGDNENDYTMIEYAGLGVAMGNAEEKIKGIAKYVTCTNDQDGVAHCIKRFVLC